MASSSHILLNATITTTTSNRKPLYTTSKLLTTTATKLPSQPCRRHFLTLSTTTFVSLTLLPLHPAAASSFDEEYVADTSQVITKIRTTINMDKTDPNVADAVAELRESSNSWVAKYRKEKELLGRGSFRDMYSALNAVSGHYVSFGPTATLPAKRKARVLEEMVAVEKALLRGK